jgi:hypothetical protein
MVETRTLIIFGCQRKILTSEDSTTVPSDTQSKENRHGDYYARNFHIPSLNDPNLTESPTWDSIIAVPNGSNQSAVGELASINDIKWITCGRFRRGLGLIFRMTNSASGAFDLRFRQHGKSE